MTIKFDEQGFALESGIITVYVTDSNGLYSHSEEQFVSVGCGLAANAYLEKPLETKEGFAIQRIENGWKYIEDHRGKVYYSIETGEKVDITEVGKISENLTALEPLAESCKWNGKKWIVDKEKKAEIKSQQQAQAWENIKAERYRRTHSGVYVASVDKWFHTDEPSRIQYLSIQQLPKVPDNLQWKTMDNSFVVMTKELLNQLLLTMIGQEQEDFANAERHRLAMLEAENPLNYDYSTGWSAIYE